jgi:hypothetical protein
MFNFWNNIISGASASAEPLQESHGSSVKKRKISLPVSNPNPMPNLMPNPMPNAMPNVNLNTNVVISNPNPKTNPPQNSNPREDMMTSAQEVISVFGNRLTGYGLRALDADSLFLDETEEVKEVGIQIGQLCFKYLSQLRVMKTHRKNTPWVFLNAEAKIVDSPPVPFTIFENVNGSDEASSDTRKKNLPSREKEASL